MSDLSPSFKRLMEFQQFLLEFQKIKRVVLVPGLEEFEDDVQHSFHLAMAGWFLAQNRPGLDTNKIIRYALAHDLVEVHAGDTFFYDEEKAKTKDRREAEAFKTIKADWKDFPEMIDAMEAYKSKRDDEARFVYALDKIMPIIVITLDQGRLWHREKITLERLKAKKHDKVAVSPELMPYYQDLLQILEKHPEYFHGGQQ